MTRRGPDRSSADYSQGKLSGINGSFDSLTIDGVDLVDLSRGMLVKLGRTIENDVIPRLMLALGSSPRQNLSVSPQDVILHDGHVDEFVHLVLHHDTPVASKYVATLRGEGCPLTAIYLDLLAPAARRLGEMWESDECSFVDVTIGVCRMHQVLLEFSRCFDPTTKSPDKGRNALILPAPGEQHTFGIFVVMEFLRRSGWDCFSGTPATARDFRTLVEAQAYGTIGISVSTDQHVEDAKAQIHHIRQRSRNRNAVILVGGYIIQQDPSLVHRIGADATASDGQQAVNIIDRLTRAQLGN
jgi:methanogenic corrinoid protein MtbC1